VARPGPRLRAGHEDGQGPPRRPGARGAGRRGDPRRADRRRRGPPQELGAAPRRGPARDHTAHAPAAGPRPPPPPPPPPLHPPPPPPGGPAAEDQQADGAGVAEPEPKAEADPLAPGSGLTYLVIDGSHVAGSGLNVPDKVAQGLSPRAYIYTDRPAYRPGQRVALRGVVREVKEGQYANTPKAVYKREGTDSGGRPVEAEAGGLSHRGRG